MCKWPASFSTGRAGQPACVSFETPQSNQQNEVHFCTQSISIHSLWFKHASKDLYIRHKVEQKCSRPHNVSHCLALLCDIFFLTFILSHLFDAQMHADDGWTHTNETCNIKCINAAKWCLDSKKLRLKWIFHIEDFIRQPKGRKTGQVYTSIRMITIMNKWEQ